MVVKIANGAIEIDDVKLDAEKLRALIQLVNLPYALSFSDSLGKDNALYNVGDAAWFVNGKRLLLYSTNNTFSNLFCTSNPTYKKISTKTNVSISTNSEPFVMSSSKDFDIHIKDTTFRRVRFTVDVICNVSDDDVSYEILIADDSKFQVTSKTGSGCKLVYDEFVGSSSFSVPFPKISFIFAATTKKDKLTLSTTYTSSQIEFDINGLPDKSYTYQDWIDVAYPKTNDVVEYNSNTMHYIFETNEYVGQNRVMGAGDAGKKYNRIANTASLDHYIIKV